jgi:hypothetical protein
MTLSLVSREKRRPRYPTGVRSIRSDDPESNGRGGDPKDNPLTTTLVVVGASGRPDRVESSIRQ